MTTVVLIQQGGTGANNAADARSALGAAPTEAYNAANNAYAQANAAYAAANTGTSSAADSYNQANLAYAQANTAYGQANAAYTQANTARSDANTTFATINTTFGTVNTAITNAHNQANLAYTQANTARSDANTTFATINATFGTLNTSASIQNAMITSAHNQANAAYNQANLAYAQANASYNEANLKLNISGGTITGSLNIAGNLIITGNTTTVNTESLVVNDPILLLANNNTTDVVDIGFVGHYGATQKHAGLVRHYSDNKFYLFTNYDEHVLSHNNIIDIANVELATLKSNIEANTLTVLNGVSGNINFDSGTLFIDSVNDRVGIKTTTPAVPFQLAYTSGTPDASLLSSDAAIITAENTAPGFAFVVAGSTSSQRGVFKATRARGTLASPTVPNSGDNVFSLLGAIYDGATNRATATINLDVDGAVSSAVAPQRITFWTGETSSRTERMRITSNGYVGIGTSSPTNLLSVAGDAIFTGNVTLGDATTDVATVNGYLVTESIAYSTSQDAPYLIAGTTSYNGAATNWGTYGFQHRFKSDSGGVPRITVDAPIGGVATELYSLDAAKVTFNVGAVFNEDGADVDFRIESDTNTNAFFVDGATGYVGIGTATPQAELVLRGSTPQFIFEPTSDVQNGRLQFALANGAIQSWISGGGSAGRDIFFIDAPTSSARMMIQGSTGNVGIRTTSPLALLHVSTSAAITAANGNADEAIFERQGAAAGITIASGNTNGGNIYFADQDSNSIGRIVYDHSVDNIALYTNNTQKLTIDSSGNVAIGTTTTTTAPLTVLTSATVDDATTRVAVFGLSNANQGQLEFRSGRDDNAFTNRYSSIQAWSNSLGSARDLILEPEGGNVGIGTIAPRTKLDVSGSIYTSWSDAFIGTYFSATYMLGISPIVNTRDLRIFAKAADDTSIITFHTGSGPTERMRIDNTGALTVGGTNSAGLVTGIKNFGNSYASSFSARATGTAQGQLAGYSFYPTFQSTPGDNGPRRAADIWAGFNGGNWTTEYLAFGVGYAAGNDAANTTLERMRINGAGDVTIGSAVTAGNTLRYFDVYNTDTGSSAGAITRLITANAAGTGLTTLDIVKYKTGGVVINNNEPSSSGFIAFNVSGSERMRITSAGNIGIGTTAPTDFGGKNLAIHSQSNSTYASTLWVSGAYVMQALINEASAVMSIGSRSNHKLDLCTNDTTRLTISNTGDVAVGTTPGQYNSKFIIQNSGNTSLMLWNSGVGSGHIGIAAASPNFKIYNTYATGLLASGNGIDIDQNGNVGIGTSSPGQRLEVYAGDGGPLIRISSSATGTGSNNGFHLGLDGSGGAYVVQNENQPIYIWTNNTVRGAFTAAGGFSIGTTANPGAGAIYATGDITAFYSDDRLKTKLGNIDNALSKVLSLNGFYFEPNQTAMNLGYENKKQVGVSAQEVKAVLPEVVVPAPIDQEYMTVHYHKLVPLLIEAIKDLNAKVESMQKIIDEMK